MPNKLECTEHLYIYILFTNRFAGQSSELVCKATISGFNWISQGLFHWLKSQRDNRFIQERFPLSLHRAHPQHSPSATKKGRQIRISWDNDQAHWFTFTLCIYSFIYSSLVTAWSGLLWFQQSIYLVHILGNWFTEVYSKITLRKIQVQTKRKKEKKLLLI